MNLERSLEGSADAITAYPAKEPAPAVEADVIAVATVITDSAPYVIASQVPPSTPFN